MSGDADKRSRGAVIVRRSDEGCLTPMFDTTHDLAAPRRRTVVQWAHQVVGT